MEKCGSFLEQTMGNCFNFANSHFHNLIRKLIHLFVLEQSLQHFGKGFVKLTVVSMVYGQNKLCTVAPHTETQFAVQFVVLCT